MSLFGSFFKKYSADLRPGKWQVGDKIADRYEIYQVLGGEGKSGMGVVYVCYDHNNKTYFALKTFQEKYLIKEDAKKLFEREALIWTELEKHPNIVRAYWVQRLMDGRLFIILEYISPDKQGRNTLTHYLKNLTLPEILKFSIQFCHGMEYAYSKGVDAHRDIKTDNIMITDDKTLKITDFGLAKAFSEIKLEEDITSPGERTGLGIFQTKAGKRACGTLQYMSPEQFDGYADKRSDVYSFGAVLYQMVTSGRLPFAGRTIQEWENLHKYEKVPAISSPLFSVIQKCLEKEQDKRYQDFKYIRIELERLLLEETGERIAMPEIAELEAWEWDNKGAAFNNIGKYDEAISCFDKALEKDCNFDKAWCDKGIALVALRKHDEALSCLHKSTKINPRYAEAYFIEGLLLFSLARLNEALSCLDKAIKINPNLTEAQKLKQFVLQKLRR